MDEKWFAALDAAIHGEMDRVSQQLTRRVKELAERYETPLPRMVERVAELEATVNRHPRNDGVRMEVKPGGYKRTEVGVIPQEWEVKPLHLLADRIMVGIASAATHAYRDRGRVMFRNQNIKRGYLDDTDLLYIDEIYEQTYRNKRLKPGDLLTARTGYPGTTSIVPAEYEGAQSFTDTDYPPAPRSGPIQSTSVVSSIRMQGNVTSSNARSVVLRRTSTLAL